MARVYGRRKDGWGYEGGEAVEGNRAGGHLGSEHVRRGLRRVVCLEPRSG